MNLLYISQRLPYPPNRGDRIPVFHHIRLLSARHRMHVASLIGGPEENDAVKALGQWATSVTVATQSPWQSRWGMLWAALTGKPLSLGHFNNGHLKTAIAEVVAREKIDAVIVFSSSMAHYVDNLSIPVRIMNFCDVDSSKWVDLAGQASFPMSWIYRREAKTLSRYERRLDADFSGSCFVTDGEVELFKRMVPDTKAVVVPNGVDHEKFGALQRSPKADTVAFVGVMDYAPNVEAAVFFAKEVLPLLRRTHHAMRFQIVGAKPTPEVKALASLPGVEVTGYVEDVREYLAKAALVVIPLAVARGIQNKVLEAVAAAVPVLVSQPVAASLFPELRALVWTSARHAKDFAATVSQILALPLPEREARSQKAQEILRRETTWEVSASRLEQLILSAKSSSGS